MTVLENAAQPLPSAPVSVIVPSYNSARFIAEALDSILAQSLQPEQIIVVDDGSTDNTEEVVRRYRDSRIQYIHKQHGGAGSARNAGLDAARGEYVAFLDADDRWRPVFLETMHSYLAEDPTVGCVFGNFVRFQHPTGELLGDQFQYYPEIKRPALLRDAPYAHGRIPREKAFSALVACGEIPARTQVMMFRRSTIERLRFDATLPFGDDTHFALRTFMLAGVVFTDAPLAEVRLHEANATRTRDEIAVRELSGLKALAPHVTRESDQRAYRDRLVKAHLDAALYQTRLGRVGAGLSTYRDCFRVPGSALRKLKGSARMLLAVPRGLSK